MIVQLYLLFLSVTCVLFSNAYQYDPLDNQTDYHPLGDFKPRILGGSAPGFHQLPFVVYIKNSLDGSSCTGSIIAPQYVITALHCILTAAREAKMLMKDAKNYLTIRVGQNKNSRLIFKASETFYGDADFLILKLNRKITFDENAASVVLKSHQINFNDKYVVVGHGDHILKKKKHDRQSYVIGSITVKGKGGFCQPKAYEFCAYGLNEGTTEGDSGGPVLLLDDGKYYQVGMIRGGGSVKTKDGVIADFGTYLKISYFCSFIKKNTQGAAACIE